MLAAALLLLAVLSAIAFLAARSAWLQRALQERAVKARILFGFVQTLSRVNISYQLQLPTSVVQFLRALAYLEVVDLAAPARGRPRAPPTTIR